MEIDHHFKKRYKMRILYTAFEVALAEGKFLSLPLFLMTGKAHWSVSQVLISTTDFVQQYLSIQEVEAILHTYHLQSEKNTENVFFGTYSFSVTLFL